MIKSQITLEEALHKESCPLCRMTREAEERLIWFILYESTGDRQLRAQWDRDKGFCKYHNNLIKMTIIQGRLVSGSSIARIYETILDSYITDLKELKRNSHIKDPLTNVKCFFCRNKEEFEKTNIDKFIGTLQNENERIMYKSSDGLCIPHLVLVEKTLNKRDKNGLQEFLAKDHMSRLEKLKSNMQELQRKERYDIKQPATPQERDSWTEALWRFSGVIYKHLLIWSDKAADSRIVEEKRQDTNIR